MPFVPPHPEHLALLYARGQLVPFIGSGLSRPACALWSEMVAGLEAEAGIEQPTGDAAADLRRRATAAVQALKRKDRRGFPAALRRAVQPQGADAEIPAATRALASLDWPLVVTTNYDDLFVRATVEAWKHASPDRRLVVCGRDRNGRGRVLDQLQMPVGGVLWAIQGQLPLGNLGGRRVVRFTKPQQLAGELVVGDQEYRATTWEEPGFRRAFGEVFRSCSLLFLGSGLREAYLQGLMEETLQLVGPGRGPHFALLKLGELDTDYLHRRFNIVAIEYDPADGDNPYANFTPALQGLLAGLQQPTVAQELRCRVGAGSLVLRRGRLPGPAELGDDEWLAFSCGRGRSAGRTRIYPSTTAQEWLGKAARRARAVPGRQYSAIFDGDEQLRGVVARDPDAVAGVDANSEARRSPRAVHAAFGELLEQAGAASVRRIHTQLVGAGRTRIFEPWVSLTQMARAYGAWARTAERPVEVVVHGVGDELWRLLGSGRLDLGELLMADRLLITVDVEAPDAPERLRVYARPGGQICDVATKLGLPLEGWKASVRPRPTATASVVKLTVLAQDGVTVEQFGLVAGSTLVLRRNGS